MPPYLFGNNMNRRIYVQKKAFFALSSQKLLNELKNLVSLKDLRIYNIYDIFQLSQADYEKALYRIFADKVTDVVHEHFCSSHPYFAVEYLPGQYDQRADSAMQCLTIIAPETDAILRSGYLIELIGLPFEDLDKVKKYCINTIETREKDLKQLELPTCSAALEVPIVEKFHAFSSDELKAFYKANAFAMNFDDLVCIQKYFIKQKRDPSETELRVLDTYWSDHCRHTSFTTDLTDIAFEGTFRQTLQNIFQQYQNDRLILGRQDKPITLMDLATTVSRSLRLEGLLADWVISDEINACTLDIEVKVEGEIQQWQLLFKNETHNHPTEIEPFGGASTCLGGAIRDPLSGRAFVYQAMRLSGSADPNEPLSLTLPGKLPQRKITTEAAQGYSAYGNQIGVATTHVAEVYHQGYKAKRMEVGMVIGAAPKANIQRTTPHQGDLIVLLGGPTGRDGVGGASGSSKEHDEHSGKNLSAEVQKGNPVVERKIQRLFRNPQATKLIKRCNDFGAGGIAVALGELSEGIAIDLDKVPVKYQGLNATELALSESQERMAVLLDRKDAALFISLACQENLSAVAIAEVTGDASLKMYHRGALVVNLERKFLETHGAPRFARVQITSPKGRPPFEREIPFNKQSFLEHLASLNVASQKGLIERFDASVGATTVLMPLGGRYQLTPAEGSAQKIPVLNGYTDAVSLATWGFHPALSFWSPLHGGAYAVVESIAKIVAMGGRYQNIRFSFQEYFRKLGTNPEHWGQPFAALLGAYQAQKAFSLAAIGGKDSMSGTFKELHVPPTLISFAVAMASAHCLVSPEFKRAKNQIYLYRHLPMEDGMPNYDSLKKAYSYIHEKIKEGKILSVKTIKDGGVAAALSQMAFGNGLGAQIKKQTRLLNLDIGSMVLESSEELSEDFIFLGQVITAPELRFEEFTLTVDQLLKTWQKTLEPIFPTRVETSKKSIRIENKSKDYHRVKRTQQVHPRVFIPVFPGTNCEYESHRAFKTEGALVEEMVFRNRNAKQIDESLSAFVQKINRSQILMLAGGFSAGDEPDGAAKFIVAVLHNPYVQEAIHALLQRDGLILGICNGFQALIKSGLLPYGQISSLEHDSPTLTFNQIGRHISQCVDIKVVSKGSPWLAGMYHQVFRLPISHGEGRFYADQQTLASLFEKGQVATQYVDASANPTLDSEYNPNGSLGAVEGITSCNGRIYGRMAHPERCARDLFKNVPGVEKDPIFYNGVQYFL